MKKLTPPFRRRPRKPPEQSVVEVLALADSVGKVFAASEPKPLYVRRDVLNAKEIIAWAKGQGFDTTLPEDDMHVTVCFSRKPVDWLSAGRRGDELQVWDYERRIMALGPKAEAIVLQFKCDELSKRWEEFLGAGATWDWPEYHPHITLTYAKPPELPLSAVQPFQGVIKLGPEIFEELEPGWADDIKENDLEGGVWRTINGRRVLIKPGESPTDAVERDKREQEGGAPLSKDDVETIGTHMEGAGSTVNEPSYKRALSSALDKLPRYSGEAFRGFGIDGGPEAIRDIVSLEPGSDFAWKNFTSFSKSRGVATDFLDYGGDHKVMIHATLRGAADLIPVASTYQNGDWKTQQEVVTKPGTRFDIQRVETKGNRTDLWIKEQ